MKQAVWAPAYAVSYALLGMVPVQAAGLPGGTNGLQQIFWDSTAPSGDFNEDGWVGGEDWAVLIDCLSGVDALPTPTPPVTVAQCLSAFDTDGDMDVDLIDYGGYQTVQGHVPIPLKDTLGRTIREDWTTPYSGRQTCGACHDIDTITNGYHFQQGRTDADGNIVVQDDYFGDGRFFVRSPGRYGKWCPSYVEAGQLAGKTNANESAIDKTSFSFVGYCGICHPGGGFGEFDRDGYRYYDAATGQFGYELSGRDPTFDGDYSLLNPATGALSQAPWDVTGISEPDCLYCHRHQRTVDGSTDLNWEWRAGTIRGGTALVNDQGESVPAYAAAATAGQGWFSDLQWAEVPEGEPPLASTLQINYSVGTSNGSLVLDYDGALHLSRSSVVHTPTDYACWGCHGKSARKKRGQTWFEPEWDVHYAWKNMLGDTNPDNDVPTTRSVACNDCHPGNIDHHTAKGNSFSGTVSDETDYQDLRTCRDCHMDGPLRHPSAPLYPGNELVHALVLSGPMGVLSCQGCHIPYAKNSADLVMDHAVTGTTVVYGTEDFLSADPFDPSNPDKSRWYPAWERKSDSDGQIRLFPVKLLLSIWWADWDKNDTPGDMSDDVIAPIPLWKVRQVTGNQPLPGVNDDNGDGKPEVNTPVEINIYIQALKGNDSYGRQVAANPVLIKGGRVWYEDPGMPDNVGSLEHQGSGLVVESAYPYGMNHNVLHASESWGRDTESYSGCDDCHARGGEAPVMDSKILVDPWATDGQPVYQLRREMIGLDPH